MKKLIATVLACVTLVTVTATVEAAQGTSPSVKYNILGLTLGMTAKQAEVLIVQRLHIPIGSGNDSYSVLPELGVYVPGRPFVRCILVEKGKMKLNLFFTEVPRSVEQGPEELWSIKYAPAITTTADKAAFIAHIHKKFGPPTRVFSQQIEYWADKDYVHFQNFSRAYTAVLNLTDYSGRLTLTNIGLLDRMQSIFNSSQKSHRQPR